MRRVLLSVFALLFLYSSTPTADTWTSIAPQVMKSIVMVDNARGLCTGFVIDDNRRNEKEKRDTDAIATAAHCNGDELYAVQEPARVIYKDEKKDLLVLEIDDTGRPALKLAKRDPEVGEEVASYGYGYGTVVDQAMFRIAHVSAKDLFIAADGIGGPLLAIDATFVSGQSGGPVVNSVGDVVMIVQMGTPSVGMGVGAEILKSKIGKYFARAPKQP